MDFETIKSRWSKRYINDGQLERMLSLTVITQEQFDQLWIEKYGIIASEIPNDLDITMEEVTV